MLMLKKESVYVRNELVMFMSTVGIERQTPSLQSRSTIHYTNQELTKCGLHTDYSS